MATVRSSGRRRSGRARCSRGCTTRSRARAASPARWICARTACACWRFELIDGSAVAGPIATSRNAESAARAAMRSGAGRLREERHAASRSPVDRPADGGVTGHKSGSLAARSDVCTPNRRENICKQPGIPVLRSPALCAGRGRYLVPCARRSAPRIGRRDVASARREHARSSPRSPPPSARPSSSCTRPSRASHAPAPVPHGSSAPPCARARVARTRRHVTVVRSSLAATNVRSRHSSAGCTSKARRTRSRSSSAPARCRRSWRGSTSSSARRA